MKVGLIMVALAFVIAAMVIFALRSEPERVAAAEVATKSPGEAPRYSSDQIGRATIAGSDLLWQRSGASGGVLCPHRTAERPRRRGFDLGHSGPLRSDQTPPTGLHRQGQLPQEVLRC